MPLKIIKATMQDRSLVKNFMNMYLHEVSEDREIEIDDEGNFCYLNFSCYWVEPDKAAYVIRVKDKSAGFVLTRDIESLRGQMIHTIPEFFLLNSYRGLGIGEEIARMVFDKSPGLWQIAVPDENKIAKAFWKSVIWRYSGGKHLEFHRSDWSGPVFEFSSPGVRSVLVDELSE